MRRMVVRWSYRWSAKPPLRVCSLYCHWSLSGMTTKANEPSKIVVSTSGSRRRPSPTPRPSGSPIPGLGTAKPGFVSTGKSRTSSLLSSIPSGKGASGSSRRGEPTLGRYKHTDSGALMRLMPDGSWEPITPQVNWDRINHTTDAEIERQEIADLVEDALELEAGSSTALAARLQVSPSSVRRWRRGRVMPSIAHQQRLKCLFVAQ